MTRMSRTTMVPLLLASLAAALTAVYVASPKSSAATGVGLQQVFVAGRDIPVGTPASKLLSGHLVVGKNVDPQSIAPTAIRSIGSLRGLVSAQPIYAGDQLTIKRFAVSHGNPTLAGLRGRQRAITIAGEPSQLLAGTLQDGDHVDVAASMTYPEGSQTHRSRIVLRGLLVLHAPTGDGSTSPGSGSTAATLALTDAQAQKFFFVVKNADWTLLLRPTVRASDTRLGGDSAATILGDGQ